MFFLSSSFLGSLVFSFFSLFLAGSWVCRFCRADPPKWRKGFPVRFPFRPTKTIPTPKKTGLCGCCCVLVRYLLSRQNSSRGFSGNPSGYGRGMSTQLPSKRVVWTVWRCGCPTLPKNQASNPSTNQGLPDLPPFPVKRKKAQRNRFPEIRRRERSAPRDSACRELLGSQFGKTRLGSFHGVS